MLHKVQTIRKSNFKVGLITIYFFISQRALPHTTWQQVFYIGWCVHKCRIIFYGHKKMFYICLLKKKSCENELIGITRIKFFFLVMWLYHSLFSYILPVSFYFYFLQATYASISGLSRVHTIIKQFFFVWRKKVIGAVAIMVTGTWLSILCSTRH